MPAERIDQHVADGREQELAEGARRRAGAEGHGAPLLRQELAEGAEHQVERAAGEAEADQHAGAEMQHAGRRRIGHDDEAERIEQRARRRARGRRRTGRRSRRRRAGRRPRAGSGSRWRSRRCRGPSRIPSIIGIWNSPAEARGPKVMRAIRQPARTMSSGETRERAGDADMVTALQGQAGARRLTQVPHQQN